MDRPARDCRFDNFRGILIFLVVLGHAIAKLQGKSLPVPGTVYSIIYSFHMPAFIFISGYFSKNALKSEHYAKQQVKTLLIPFIAAQLLMWLITSRSVRTLFSPGWTLWYLLSLFIWKMLVVPVSKIRYSVVITFLMSLCIGFASTNSLFSVSRTVAFFPVFLIGYKTTADEIRKMEKIHKIIPVLILAALFSMVLILKKHGLSATVFMMAKPYASLKGITGLQGMLFRLIALLTGILSTFCLLALMPRKQGFITTLGRNTMTVYLGHSYCLLAVEKLVSRLPSGMTAGNTVVLLVSLILAVIICLLFGNNRVAAIYNRILDRVSSLILVNDRQDTAGPEN